MGVVTATLFFCLGLSGELFEPKVCKGTTFAERGIGQNTRDRITRRDVRECLRMRYSAHYTTAMSYCVSIWKYVFSLLSSVMVL